MDKHTARQAIIDYCERENIINPMSAISIPYELVEDLLAEYCTTLDELLNTQRGLCGTNAELSKAWDKGEKLEADLIKLAIYVGALARDCYDVSTFLLVHGYPDPWAKSRKILNKLPEDVIELLEKYR